MSTTINKEEIQKFSKLADEWWDVNGKFKPLHMFNPVRIEYIVENIKKHFKVKNDKPDFLRGLKILDIGCGGGLLCEPLKRLGAKVTGIDASKQNIEIAKFHAKEMNLNIDYIHCEPKKLNSNKKFDVILNMEIVEHVSNIELFIEDCSKLINKNGIMFVATINKNLKSYLFAIVGAEYILRWLPIGTHQWDKFITPEKLKNIAKKKKFSFNEIVGMKFNFLLNKWYRTSDISVNYISTFLKD